MAGYDGAGGAKRKARGFQRAAAAAAPLVRAAGAPRGFAEQRLLRDWPVVAGETFAAICRPVRMSWRGPDKGLGATLVVSADGPRATEVEHMADRLIERVNQVYGYCAVSRLRVVQTGAPPAPSRRLRDDAPPLPERAPLPDISAVTNPDLRAALTLLEHNIRRRAAQDTENRSRPR